MEFKWEKLKLMEILSNMETYTFYIDESGDSNTTKVRTEGTGGATPYMVLGGALVKDKDNELIKSELEDIKKTINKSLHCAQLNHLQTRYFAKSITRLDVVLFGLISDKGTINKPSRNGVYSEQIGEDFWKYYHKCTVYLLEKLCHYMKENNISRDQINIVIEDSNSFKLQKFKNYIPTILHQPSWKEYKILNLIETNNIAVADKDEKLLQLADIVAYSLFRCVDNNKSYYGIYETAYLNDLKNKFYHCSDTAKIVSKGIKPIHSLDELKLSDDVKNFFNNLKNE